jgi:ATP-dependent DNA helicase RecG
MAFVSKHLPSPFYLEGTSRIDIRNIIFREIAVNLLVHREYTNHYPAKLVIERNRIFTENGNKPYIHGNINPAENSPYPKNPTLARFFKEIGLADELGSGVRKITQYAEAYAGSQPILSDSDIFKLTWQTNLFEDVKPLDENTAAENDEEQKSSEKSSEKNEKGSEKSSEKTVRNNTRAKILNLLQNDPYASATQLSETLGMTSRAVEKHLSQMREENIIRRVGPDKGGRWEVMKS